MGYFKQTRPDVTNHCNKLAKGMRIYPGAFNNPPQK